MARNGTVWILGAGFSRSLGAPLLRDLFSKTSKEVILGAFSRDEYPELQTQITYAAHWLYHAGAKFPEGEIFDRADLRFGFQLWRDAEEYLDYLDAAAELGDGAAPNKFLKRKIREKYESKNKPELEDLMRFSAAARRLLAAECCSFLVSPLLSSERWQPYFRWARQVDQDNDTIITFNYDTLLERLGADSKQGKHIKFDVLRPGDEPEPGVPPVLKLHGSLNWRRIQDHNGVRFEILDDYTFALRAPDSELAIASPGPSKLARTKELLPLWRVAEDALENATAIIFVGYRFPPTDSESRRRLLDAIARNRQNYLPVHTVLGPRVRDPETQRLRNLLLFSARQNMRREIANGTAPSADELRNGFNLVSHPLYAEDYFSVCARGQWEQPYLWGGGC